MISFKNVKPRPILLLFALFIVACDSSDSTSSAELLRQSHSPIEDYEKARTVFWNEVYAAGGTTLYCGEKFGANRGRGFNIEHVFPMSWVTKALACGTRKQCRNRSDLFNFIEADMHNLFPTLTEINAARSFYRFAEIGGEKREYGPSCDFEVDHRRRLAEPRKEVRGDIARAMFYMAFRYKDQGLKIFSRTGRVLAQWHEVDPPSRHEKVRNDRIAQLQGNRNPFIDDPERLSLLIRQNEFY